MKRLSINTLDKGWCDRDEVMLHACFQLLVDYLETEADAIDWDAGETHRYARGEMQELYDWWTAKGWEGLDQKKDDMLMRLIKIRGFMWS